MEQCAHIISATSNIGLPFGLPQIIADYASWSDDERLDELFRVNNGRCLIFSSVLSILELREVDYLVMVSYTIGKYKRQDYWRKCFIVSLMADKKFENILDPMKHSNLDPQLVNDLVNPLYEIWRGL